MIREWARDVIEMARVSTGRTDARAIANTLLQDSVAVVMMNRVRESARRWHVPGVNRMLRLAQIALYGIEIGKDVRLGQGLYCVHTVGIVIGGDAQIGNRVKLMGNNTIGTAKNNGYPVIEDDVVIGCGARVLGPVRIGAGSVIGANAVVLNDIPPGSIAVGIPATVRGTVNSNKRDEGDAGQGVRPT